MLIIISLINKNKWVKKIKNFNKKLIKVNNRISKNLKKETSGNKWKNEMKKQYYKNRWKWIRKTEITKIEVIRRLNSGRRISKIDFVRIRKWNYLIIFTTLINN